ncbi:MAG TPA: TonB-dependent receptor [Bryobacteraceae bacterium]|nr:TonB-dependent receptor [Bryobacteraceae bacterium]
MKIWNHVSFALIAGIICGPLTAQLPTATVLGVVTDDTGAVVPGATVMLRNVETGQTRTTDTDGAGSYRLPALNVGNYEARIAKEGFQTIVVPGITLTVSQEATINATLKVGAVGQQVEVQGTVQAVNTDSATLGGLVTEQKVAELPLNGRNLVQLTLQEIGVVQNSSYTFSAGFTGTMINANGGSIRSNNWLLDGSPAQNYYGANNSSISGTTLGLEGIREFRILTSGIGAEYGGTMGAQVLMVSKGGTNQVHGSAFDYLRNSDLDARSPFDPHQIPAFERNNFGGSLGGPIKKDKTFVFGTYEGLKSRTGVTLVDNVMAPGCHGPAGAVITNAACPQLGSTASVTVSPTIAPILVLFPLPNLPKNQYSHGFNEPNSESYGQVRLDHTFSTKDSLFGRYTIDNDEQTAPLAYPGYKIIEFSQNQYITAAENHIFSPALLNTLRFSYMQTLLSTDSPTGIIGPNYSFVSGLEIGSVGIGGVTGMSAEVTSPAYFNQYLEHYSDDVFYTKGRHSLKFGAALLRYDLPFLNNTNLRGGVSFASIANFFTATASSYSEATPGQSHERDFLYMTMGFYAQDDFKVNSRLTLNLGLRYEPGTVPSEVNGRSAALRNPVSDSTPTIGPLWRNYMLKNWSPRIGFAWDATGDGKTSVRGSFARLEDVNDMGGVIDISANGTAPFATILSCGTPTVITLPLSYSSCLSGAAPSQRTPKYFMEQPHLLTYSFSLQRQLPWDTLLTAAYAGSRGLNLMRTLEYNPILPQIANGQPFWPAGGTRRNPNWGYIGLNTSEGSSWYNALQLELLKRLSSGLQFQLSYTRSRAIGDTQAQLGSDNTAVSPYNTNPLNYRQDYSVVTFNSPNNFRFNAIYNFPNVQTAGFVGGVLRGWWVGTLVGVQTGLPFTVALNSNRSRSGVSGGGAGIDRPNLAPGATASKITSGTTAGCLGVPAGEKLGTPSLYYDPCAFTLQPQGTLGNAGQNILEGPGQRNVDFSLVKDTAITKLGEGTRLQFRTEVFNLLNHPFFNFPSRIAFAGTAAGSGSNVEQALPTAGVINSILGIPRQIQFALKLIF